MNDERQTFSLTSNHPDEPAPVLAGASVEGRLDGILLDLTLRQTYRNTSGSVLEVVYTFPLPARAVLLGFASELGGARLVGTVVARRDAEVRYEKALAAGDAPVLLEAHAEGLHTANIGNLKPGEEIVLEVRYAQLLAFEQGRLRLSIPTTVAPRYGSAERSGFEPQQVPEPSMGVDHPLTLSVTVGGSLGRAQVECPTHRCTLQAVDGGQTLQLLPGARLDRDVVIVVQPLEPLPSFVVRAGDERSSAAPVVALAALQPPEARQREAIALKLLVDCSGSMGGDSIASAQAALQEVLGELREGDLVSLTRFGSTVDHVSDLLPCTMGHLEQLQARVRALNADLGGTEMEAALQQVFALGSPRPVRTRDVLLLTDGEIWQAQSLIDAARRSGHRVFAIGVGSAPAEGVLRSLAEATGGACEFATPGESLKAAVRRMMPRIRQQVWSDVRVDWGARPEWQVDLPHGVFAGDTVVALAGFKASTPPKAVRLLATAVNDEVELARGEAEAASRGDALARIAAARRAGTADDAAALALCVSYQLMGKQTSCILVHERAEGDRVDDEARLHRVSPMLAAGWGATATVRSLMVKQRLDPVMPMMCSIVLAADSDSDRYGSASFERFEAAPVSQPEAVPAEPQSLRGIATAVAEHLAWGGDVPGLVPLGRRVLLHPDAQQAWDGAVALGASPVQAWLLLAHWINWRKQGLGSVELVEALRRPVAAIDPRLLQRCMELFDRELAAFALDDWTLSRAQRLRRAVTRAVS